MERNLPVCPRIVYKDIEGSLVFNTNLNDQQNQNAYIKYGMFMQ